jgi:tetratricopeptide (TPR) repeat protein
VTGIGQGVPGSADPGIMRIPLVALLVCVLGTGAVAWSPLGEPLIDPALDALEAYREQARGPWRGEHVDDREDLLGPFVRPIEHLANAFWADLGIDVQVVTVRAHGEVLSVVAESVLHERMNADRATTGALLVLIDTAERRARIEPTYDLEGVFPDVVLKRLAADQLAPYASYNAAGMAVMDVLHLLKDHALEEALRGNLPLIAELKPRPAYKGRDEHLTSGAGARAKLPELPADADWKLPVPPRRRGRYAPSKDPWKTLAAYERVLDDLAGDPTLELFTPGSRVMRRYLPVAPYEQHKRQERLAASRPLRLLRRGDRVVFLSDRPTHGFVPVLLRRDDGEWRVDLVETWKNLFFDSQGDYMLYNTSSPYAFGLGNLLQGEPRGLLPVDLEGEDLEAALARLEARRDPRSRLELAEILLRNCFASVPALAHYEEAARLAPGDPEIARVYGERALYFGYTDLAIRELKRAGPGLWHRVAHAYAEAGDWQRAARYYRRALRRNPDSLVARQGLAHARERAR